MKRKLKKKKKHKVYKSQFVLGENKKKKKKLEEG